MAYDYDNQRWIDGDAGTRLAIAQIDEELSIYRGVRGAEYRAMIANDTTPRLETIIEALQTNRARLVRSLAQSFAARRVILLRHAL